MAKTQQRHLSRRHNPSRRRTTCVQPGRLLRICLLRGFGCVRSSTLAPELLVCLRVLQVPLASLPCGCLPLPARCS